MMDLENITYKNYDVPLVYYIIIGWSNRNKMADYRAEYPYLEDAEKNFNELIESGKFQSVILRKESVWHRDGENAEVSNSSPVICWDKQKEVKRYDS